MSGQNWPHVLNLSNSIIGVTVLAMPFCYKECGIVLGTALLFFSTWITLKSCQLLMRAGVTSRKRSYGFLAQYTHGAPGKIAVEIGMIGLQVGTLIAQVVIIGDLGPAIVSKWTGLQNTGHLRIALIMVLCLCVGLPLGLLRNLEAVSRASTLCIMFYSLFVIYVMSLAVPNLKAANWIEKVNLWKTDGLFKCLPIFSFAFGCQTQLFILYDALPEPSLKEIKSIVASAVNMCTVAYLLVGFFGYIAFCDKDIGGDIITQFSETLVSDLLKIGFVISIAITFPLIIFPCRGSLYTLLFPQRPKLNEDIESRPIIPEIHFKALTIFIVTVAMVTGILVPNVEFVLAMNGATMGTLICYIFPAVFFLRVMTGSSGKNVAQIVLIIGFTIMFLCTYTTLNSQDHMQPEPIVVPKEGTKAPLVAPKVTVSQQPAVDVNNKNIAFSKKPPDKREEMVKVNDDKRVEPPNPKAPEDVIVEKNGSDLNKKIIKRENTPDKEKDAVDNGEKTVTKLRKKKFGDRTVEKVKEKSKVEEVLPTEKEKKKDEKNEQSNNQKEQKELLQELKKQQAEQKKLIEEQKEILNELKQHKQEVHDNMQPVKVESNNQQEQVQIKRPRNEVINTGQKEQNQGKVLSPSHDSKLDSKIALNGMPVQQSPANMKYTQKVVEKLDGSVQQQKVMSVKRVEDGNVQKQNDGSYLKSERIENTPHPAGLGDQVDAGLKNPHVQAGSLNQPAVSVNQQSAIENKPGLYVESQQFNNQQHVLGNQQIPSQIGKSQPSEMNQNKNSKENHQNRHKRDTNDIENSVAHNIKINVDNQDNNVDMVFKKLLTKDISLDQHVSGGMRLLRSVRSENKPSLK